MFHEDEIEIPEPDFSTVESTRKALSDVHIAAKSLRDANGKLRGDLEAMKTDLVRANQALAELQRAPAPAADGPDSMLRSFVRDDGKVRAVGELSEQEGWVPGLLDSEPVCAWQKELQDLVETRNIVRRIRTGSDPTRAKAASPRCDLRIRRHVERAPASIKRAFGDISTAGAEWYPDILLPVVEREFMLERRVAALFKVVPMSGKNLLHPFLSTGLRPYLKSAIGGDDPSQYTSSSLTTAQRSIDAVGFAVRSQLDEEATEDAIVDSMGIIRQELIAALVDGEEDAILNGDSAATHQDTGLSGWNIRSRWGSSGLGGAADHRRAWIGLRARATDVSNTTDGGSAETTAGFLTSLATMDSPHGLSGDRVCIVSPEYYLAKMLGLSEVLTAEKFGPKATVLTGQLAALLGTPIVLSEFIDKQLNASGVYDNTTKTKTGYLNLNRARFFLGMRRGSAVEIEKDITRGLYNLVSTVREVFFTLDSSTKKNVAWDYNHSVS